jgi:hypothetical protein
MDRRRFLQLLGLGGAAVVFDPERLLWVPGQQTIIDLGAGVRELPYFAGNALLTPEWVTQEALRVLRMKLELIEHINRTYDDPWFHEARHLR